MYKDKQQKAGAFKFGVFYDYGNVLIQAGTKSQFGQPVVVNINELDGKTVYR